MARILFLAETLAIFCSQMLLKYLCGAACIPSNEQRDRRRYRKM
jgi:hypothetical protein